MATFKDLSDRFKALNFNAMSEQVISQQVVKEWIIETAQNRIIDTGIDAFNEPLFTNNAARGEVYSFQTIQIKAEKGQKFRNVTLEDTGSFYDSWVLTANKTFYSIKAKFKKGNENIFDNFDDSFSNFKHFEDAVLSLTDSEMSIFIQKIFLPRFLQVLKNEIF